MSRIQITVALTLWLATTPAQASVVETFVGYPPGTVVAGQLPHGGIINSGIFFDNIENIVVTNNAGPNTLAIFDSSNPSVPDDFDLGTPNQSCGGPGIGSGGTIGAPGENCAALGNLLIISENLIDVNHDNMLDAPDDEEDGGTILFDFERPVSIATVTLVDVDSETAFVELYSGSKSDKAHALDLGHNSVQTLTVGGSGVYTHLRVHFSGSGGIGQISYEFPVSVEIQSWGAMKARYR